MIAFWVAAALLSAAVAVLIVMRALRAAGQSEPEDPSLGVYRRQLSEIDDLAARGLLPEAEQRSARAEAARRLLSAADAAPTPPAPLGRRTLAVAIVLAALVPLVALALYFKVGSPQTPDQPFAARLKAWSADPSALEPAQMAAVLQHVADMRPTDPQPLVFLARADVAAQDPVGAEQALRKALRLDPKNAALWSTLGEVLAMEAQTGDSPTSRAAFQQALALDPKLPGPRYYLGHDEIGAGDVKDGLPIWKALDADLPVGDPRRQLLDAQIAIVEKTGALPTDQSNQSDQQPANQQAMIEAMVARQAAQLQAQPDDPQGWGRLIRSYTVLGDTDKVTAATAQATALFKDRPDAMRQLQQAEAGGQ